ncbi:LytTR family transcriptional regulator DNA-binding domain-containing protein [Flavobacteriaceae bacterium S356]|uniref:LytTR family transcriptional regulator DNA-binding domain-containing protein n=1 Tax=Asprobacillus argus TaxID=3076534 RepID=A0ABU3LDE8_9FLAO|nr:LytTR family transcriptional regulator DNA-binding domain-containing protein [Flavobacteriaceae bacterium S356]
MKNSVSILIVEDEFLTSDFIKDVLEDIGYRISGIARSVDEACFILDKEDTDIALLDINIHGEKDGIDLAKIINAKYKIPFVFLTAFMNDKTVNAALATNPSAYLVKPFSKVDVYTSIEVALRNYTENREANIEHNTVISKDVNKTFIGEQFLFVKQREVYTKVLIEDLLYFHSEMKYIDMHTENMRYTVRYTLSDIIQQLQPHPFIQVHRSYVVNFNRIKKVGSNYVLIEDHKLPLGPSYKKNVLTSIKFLK